MNRKGVCLRWDDMKSRMPYGIQRTQMQIESPENIFVVVIECFIIIILQI